MNRPIATAIATAWLFRVAAAAETHPPGACSLVPGSQACVDETPCKALTDGHLACLAGASLPTGALALTQTCWKYSYEYACDEAAPANTCTPYENNSACAIAGSVCTDHKPETGACVSWNFTYRCQTSAAETGTQLQCSSRLFDTSSMTAPASRNATFAKAALAMEIARETQVYAGPYQTVFNGVPESCTKGYFGLRNCCSGTPGATSNRGFMQKIAGDAAFSVAKYAGEKLVDTASPYVFDAMYQNAEYFSAGLLLSAQNAENVVLQEAGAGFGQAIGTNFASQGTTLGAYGFTYGSGTLDMTTALPGTLDLSSTFGMSAGDGFITFNPYVFAAELALQYLMSLAQCSQVENVFQMHKGANLTVYIRDECSKRVLGACVEHTEHYCSFNSVLARIINVQGKTQMGKDVGDCTGLTPDQVGRLDFTRIDFSEFTGQLLGEAQAGLPTNINGNYTPLIQNTSRGALQDPGNGMAYPPGAAPASPPATH
jgi:conjugal transfer mating pair stabilization protein TraN